MAEQSPAVFNVHVKVWGGIVCRRCHKMCHFRVLMPWTRGRLVACPVHNFPLNFLPPLSLDFPTVLPPSYQTFIDGVWHPLRDPKLTMREAAVQVWKYVEVGLKIRPA